MKCIHCGQTLTTRGKTLVAPNDGPYTGLCMKAATKSETRFGVHETKVGEASKLYGSSPK